jgi:drug/metabolite transporter (DMT)-like permease
MSASSLQVEVEKVWRGSLEFIVGLCAMLGKTFSWMSTAITTRWMRNDSRSFTFSLWATCFGILTVAGFLLLLVVPFVELTSEIVPTGSECIGYRRTFFLLSFAFIAGGTVALDHPAKMLVMSCL